MRLIDLQRRKSDLLSKEIEQQKIILEKMKAGDVVPEKRKKLYKVGRVVKFIEHNFLEELQRMESFYSKGQYP